MIRIAALGILLALSGAAQDPQPDNDILILGEKLLGQAKEQYEKRQWLDCMEQAERARTAFLALAELYSSQKRAAEIRKPNDYVTRCNELIRLARDARKADMEKAAAVKPPIKDSEKQVPVPAPVKEEVPESAKAPEKPGVPSAAAQEQAEKTVREVFKAEYAKIAAPDRRALAQKLLKQGVETQTDRAAQYILFREAADVAALSGDLKTALVAIEETGKLFAVDLLALKVAAVTKLSPVGPQENPEPLIEGCFRVAEEVARSNAYEIAQILLRKAEALSRNPLHVTLLAQAQARGKDLAEAQKEHLGLGPAEKVLAEAPEDPAACLQLGRFYCFTKGDWDRGLPLLRRSSDAALRKIAETEAADVSGAELRMDVADAWFGLAEKESGPLQRAQLRGRARTWYERALPGLTGFPKTKVTTRLQEMEEEEKSRWSINLLKLIDLKKDSMKGEWTLEGSSIVTPVGQGVRLDVPYSPPEEYDLRIVVTKKGGGDAFIVGLVGGGKQFVGIVDGWAMTAGGIDQIDGKSWHLTDSVYKARIFTDGKPRTILYSVRRTRVTLSVDDKVFMDWKADYKRVSLWKTWAAASKRCLFLSAWDSSYQVNQMWLTPISAQGQKLR